MTESADSHFTSLDDWAKLVLAYFPNPLKTALRSDFGSRDGLIEHGGERDGSCRAENSRGRMIQ